MDCNGHTIARTYTIHSLQVMWCGARVLRKHRWEWANERARRRKGEENGLVKLKYMHEPVVDIGGTHWKHEQCVTNICYCVLSLHRLVIAVSATYFTAFAKKIPFFRHKWTKNKTWNLSLSHCVSVFRKRKWINIAFVVHWLHFTIAIFRSNNGCLSVIQHVRPFRIQSMEKWGF